MEVSYTEEQGALRAAVRDLLADRSPIEHVRRVAEGDTGADLDLYRALAADVGAADLPGPVELGLVLEECGRALAPVPLTSAVAIALPALAAAGAQDLVAATRAGDAIPVLLTEEPRGAPVLAAEAHVATHIVFATGGDLRVAEAGACSITQVPTMDTTRRLAEVTVDASAGEAVGDAAAALDAARVAGAAMVAAELVGVGQACLERASAHVKTREQFGKPIGAYQAVSHRVVDTFIAVESARSHAIYAAWAVGEGTDDAALAASRAKAAAGDAAIFAAQSAIQVHGGIGFTWEHDLHLFLKRARGAAALLGTPTVHRRRVADLLGV